MGPLAIAHRPSGTNCLPHAQSHNPSRNHHLIKIKIKSKIKSKINFHQPASDRNPVLLSRDSCDTCIYIACDTLHGCMAHVQQSCNLRTRRTARPITLDQGIIKNQSIPSPTPGRVPIIEYRTREPRTSCMHGDVDINCLARRKSCCNPRQFLEQSPGLSTRYVQGFAWERKT